MNKHMSQWSIYLNFQKQKIKKYLVLDPMLATGNSSIAAINLIKKQGC